MKEAEFKSLLPGAGSSGPVPFRGETHLFGAGVQMRRGVTPDNQRAKPQVYKFYKSKNRPQKKNNACDAESEPRNLFNMLLTPK